jgi:hypothetical protein
MMQLMAFDQSVRGFAFATAPTFWGGDWGKVVTGRIDGGPVKLGSDAAVYGARQDRIVRFVDTAVCEHNPNHCGFESYAYSAKPNTEVVEVVGAIKYMLRRWQKTYETVQQSSWRATLGKIKRGEEKDIVEAILVAAGAPAGLTNDQYDALGVLNLMLKKHGGQALV